MAKDKKCRMFHEIELCFWDAVSNWALASVLVPCCHAVTLPESEWPLKSRTSKSLVTKAFWCPSRSRLPTNVLHTSPSTKCRNKCQIFRGHNTNEIISLQQTRWIWTSTLVWRVHHNRHNGIQQPLPHQWFDSSRQVCVPSHALLDARSSLQQKRAHFRAIGHTRMGDQPWDLSAHAP